MMPLVVRVVLLLLSRDMAAACDDLFAACPDFQYTCPSHDWKEEPGKVIATWVVKGTHTGADYSPMPGVPAVEKKEAPVACTNDPEKLTFYFVGGKVSKLVVDALPGGKGFSGPIGFYLQMGGDPSKLPPPPAAAVPADEAAPAAG